MTGDSDDELGNPGDSPVPAELPPQGEPLYRPLRGWASAYQPEPSLWSKIGGLFSRKKKVEDVAELRPLDATPAHEPETSALETPELEPEFEPAAIEPPLLETPVLETPLLETPVLETPDIETPVLESPGPETDDAEPSEEYHEHFDAAFDAPRSTIEVPKIAEPVPPVRDYQMRGGEEVDDLPVVREYDLHPEDEAAADDVAASEPPGEPQFIPARSLLDDEVEEKKPGFFARLFGFGRKPAQPVPVVESVPAHLEAVEEFEPVDAVEEIEPVEAAEEVEPVEAVEAVEEVEPVEALEAVEDVSIVEAVEERTPVPAPRLDRPSIEFFMRVDRAGDTPAGGVPSLDDALPMADLDAPVEGVEADLGSRAAELSDVEDPTQPWIPAIPEPDEKKPGFFARLFGAGRKKQPAEEFAAAEESAWTDEPRPIESQRTDEVYSAFDEALPAAEPDVEEFASVEDALPGEDALPVEAAPTPEPRVDFETTQDAFFFDAPPPPPSFDKPFTTLEMDAPLPPPEPPEGRTTIELEAVPEHAPTFDGNMVDLDSTMAEPTPAADSRSTVQAAPIDDDITTGEMVPPTPPEVTAAMEAERPPFFVPKFRAFYNEIVSHKTQKAEFTAGFATAVMDYTADLTPDAAAQQLQKRLTEILELQAAEATWMGGEAAARYPDAQYAMAALADEVFAHIDWPGRDAWPKYQVEQKLFRSNAKDIEFFKRVDKLLKNESEKPSGAAKDLARMYLLVLAAGFQGKYRPFGLTRPLAEYRRRLYEFVSGKDPLMIYAEERKLFPEAAERVVVGRAVSRFSMLQQWAAVLVILLIGYAVISQVAWNRVSADLKDVTARVEAANTSATSDGLAGDPR